MKFGSPQHETKRAKTEIRQLSGAEIQAGIDLFARSLPRHWPISEQEARSWIVEEFEAEKSVVFGYFWQDRLVGTSALSPFNAALFDVDPVERDLLTKALQEQFPRVDITSELMHYGGLAVEADFEGMGIARKICEYVAEYAKTTPLKGLFAQTARPSQAHPNLHGLEIAKSMGFRELHLTTPLTFPDSRLEKVWLYMGM